MSPFSSSELWIEWVKELRVYLAVKAWYVIVMWCHQVIFSNGHGWILWWIKGLLQLTAAELFNPVNSDIIICLMRVSTPVPPLPPAIFCSPSCIYLKHVFPLLYLLLLYEALCQNIVKSCHFLVMPLSKVVVAPTIFFPPKNTIRYKCLWVILGRETANYNSMNTPQQVNQTVICGSGGTTGRPLITKSVVRSPAPLVHLSKYPLARHWSPSDKPFPTAVNLRKYSL